MALPKIGNGMNGNDQAWSQLLTAEDLEIEKLATRRQSGRGVHQALESNDPNAQWINLIIITLLL